MENPVAKWLNSQEKEILEQLAIQAATLSPEDLKKQSKDHVEAARNARAENGFANIALADAIHHVICEVFDKWPTLDAEAQYWLKGAVAYFVFDNDEVQDFGSPIGLEDDVEVLNACLDFAGLYELFLVPEDYDHV